jgi:hypothetical protein
MTRTIWLAFFCLVGLGAAVAIKTAMPFAALVVEPTADQSRIEPTSAPNELAKSDRLELSSTRVETEDSVPPAKILPAEIPSDGPEAIKPETIKPDAIKKVADRRWQDANARANPVVSHRRHAKRSESKKSGATPSSNARAEVWHCRRDAMGSLLRSLDLSPRCDL